MAHHEADVRQDLKSGEAFFDGELGTAIEPVDLDRFACRVSLP
jgi:hypothetical protein